MILIDAGPLVALVHGDDARHHDCMEAFRRIREPLATVLPVISEALHLLDFSLEAQELLWQLLEDAPVAFLPVEQADHHRIRELMRKYRDLPMDFADAALVRVAEREGIRKVFTIDRRDFQVYRPSRLGRFTVIP